MSHGWFVSFHGTEFRFIPAPWVTEDPEEQEPNLLVRVSSSPHFWLFLRMEHPIIQLSGPLRSPTALTLPLGPILLHVEPWDNIFLHSCSMENLVGVELYPASSQASIVCRLLHWTFLLQNARDQKLTTASMCLYASNSKEFMTSILKNRLTTLPWFVKPSARIPKANFPFLKALLFL